MNVDEHLGYCPLFSNSPAKVNKPLGYCPLFSKSLAKVNKPLVYCPSFRNSPAKVTKASPITFHPPPNESAYYFPIDI